MQLLLDIPGDVGRRQDHGAGHGSILRFGFGSVRKITRSRTTNCTTHKAANTPRFAAGSAMARHTPVDPFVSDATRATARVDTARPVIDSTQNGSTSRLKLPRPGRVQTHD